jgi:hypothetical protein
LLSAGISLRIIDSYIVTATSNRTTNQTELRDSLAAAIRNFVGSGMMKVPPGMTLTQVTSFANSLAWVVTRYKVATHCTALCPN